MMLILVLLIMFNLNFCYIFENGHRLVINTSLPKQTLSLSLSTSKMQKFQIINKGLFISSQSIILQQDNKSLIVPQLNPQTILYNDITQNQYWLGFKIPLSQQIHKQNYHFATLTIKSNNQQKLFLAPMLSYPMSMLCFQRIYRCQQVLVFLDISQGIIDLAIISENSLWEVSGLWNWQWRKNDHQLYYGRFVQKQINKQIRLKVKNNKQCKINLDTLLVKNYNSQIKEYFFNFRSIFQKAIQISSFEINDL